MKRSNMLGAYLEKKYAQQQKRVKRQKRIAAGLPDSAPLRQVSLSTEQKEAVSTAQAIQEEHGERKRTAKSLALAVSAGFHVMFGWLIAIFIIQAQPVDNDKVSVDLFQADPPQEKRRLEPRVRKEIKRQTVINNTTKLPQRTLTTAANIPTDNTGFTIPADDLASTMPTDVDGGPKFKQIEGQPTVRVPEKTITTTTPSIAPTRNTVPSLSDQFQDTVDIPDIEFSTPETTLTTEAPIQRPRFRKQKEPKYPELARQAGKEGVVVLEATIGTDGIATNIKVLEKLGHGFDEAAIAALKDSRFIPAKKDKKDIAIRIRIPYRFELDNKN